MNYYPFHIGDYLSATRHLSWEEDAAYRRLLDTYYTTEKPLPKDLKQVCRLVLATTQSQREAVQTVLDEFFEATDEGWINQRAAREIARLKRGHRWVLDVTNTEWSELRLAVFDRDKYRCAYCSSYVSAPECDHVFPLSLGGRSSMENLATSCKRCNRSKGAKTLNEWRRT